MKNGFCLLVVLVLFLTIPVWAKHPKNMKPGVERWAIKTSVLNLNETPKKVSFEDLIGLTDPTGVTKNDPRYQNTLIPAFPNSLKLEEGDIVQVSGWLHLVAYETDGDFHIQISSSDTSGDHCLIVEVPYPHYVEDSPDLRKLAASVRDFIKTNFLKGKDPSASGTILKTPAYVTITGQLFYDDSHVGDPPRGKRKMHAATLWEIHPIIEMQFAGQ